MDLMPESAELARTGQPCVSIIVPTYNRLAFLVATIASIRNQTFEDWELLIADDGSGAELRAYLEQLKEASRTRVLYLPHTGNPPAVRNAALLHARGRYVAFLDSDDLWLSQKLELQVNALRARAGSRWSYTGFLLVDEHGEALASAGPRTWPGRAGWILDSLLTEQATVAQSSVLVERDLLVRAGGYDEGLPVCGDYELWIRLSQHSEADYIAQPLVQVRRHRHHYADDVTALRDLAQTLKQVQSVNAAPHLRGTLQRRRAAVSANLARGYAVGRNARGVLGTVWSDAHCFWRYPRWWVSALGATAWVLAPRSVLAMTRSVRRWAA
jgi:glycosyltransferase involved in cell wall biosynthesis